MRTFIEGLPKAELHLHLEGTLEPELKFRLADRNGVDLPYETVEEMRAAYDFDDLPSFLAVYYEGMSVLLTEDDFFDLAYAYFEKASSQNVVYAEVFFDPQAHTARGISFETVITGIRRAQEAAAGTLGLRSQLIMCFLRDLSAEIRVRGLGLTVCPISNSYVTDGLKAEEVRQMLDAGLAVCVNSDDPAYFPGYMTENLLAVQEAAGLSREQVARLIRNAFEMTWLEASDQRQYLDRLNEYLAANPG